MGLNTTVVILNDGLHRIKENPKEFADNLCGVIARGERKSISCGMHANVAQVIETHHADLTAVVAVGGNCGTNLSYVGGYNHHTKEGKVKLLKELADHLGYHIRRKPK